LTGFVALQCQCGKRLLIDADNHLLYHDDPMCQWLIDTVNAEGGALVGAVDMNTIIEGYAEASAYERTRQAKLS
jgi:hypothetical protein